MRSKKIAGRKYSQKSEKSLNENPVLALLPNTEQFPPHSNINALES